MITCLQDPGPKTLVGKFNCTQTFSYISHSISLILYKVFFYNDKYIYLYMQKVCFIRYDHMSCVGGTRDPGPWSVLRSYGELLKH